MDERVTIYQWAALWDVGDVEEHVRHMLLESILDPPSTYLLDTNVWCSIAQEA